MAKNHLLGCRHPGLYDSIYVRPLLILFLDILLLPCVNADPVALGPQDGVDLGVGQHLTMALGLGSWSVVQLTSSPLLQDQG